MFSSNQIEAANGKIDQNIKRIISEVKDERMQTDLFLAIFCGTKEALQAVSDIRSKPIEVDDELLDAAWNLAEVYEGMVSESLKMLFKARIIDGSPGSKSIGKREIKSDEELYLEESNDSKGKIIVEKIRSETTYNTVLSKIIMSDFPISPPTVLSSGDTELFEEVHIDKSSGEVVIHPLDTEGDVESVDSVQSNDDLSSDDEREFINARKMNR
jgi:hypothetical protein